MIASAALRHWHLLASSGSCPDPRARIPRTAQIRRAGERLGIRVPATGKRWPSQRIEPGTPLQNGVLGPILGSGDPVEPPRKALVNNPG